MSDEREEIFTMDVSEYPLLQEQRSISQEDFWNHIYDRYDEFRDDIYNVLLEYYPKVKSLDSYCDNFIAHQIFRIQVKEKDLKILHKNSLIAILKELDWLKEELIRFQNVDYNSNIFVGEITYLWNVIYSIQEFVEIVQSYNEKKNCRHHYSRRRVSSEEIAYLSRRMPRFEYYFDDIAQGPVSLFLIRQEIELRITEILGIVDITTFEDNSIVKVTPDKLLSVLKSSQITLPMEYALIEKIHNWTNLYIHRARIYDYWIMEWAIRTIQPFIFEPTKVDYIGQ